MSRQAEKLDNHHLKSFRGIRFRFYFEERKSMNFSVQCIKASSFSGDKKNNDLAFLFRRPSAMGNLR